MKLFSTFAPMLALALVATAGHAETYALCVGVNDYADLKDASGNPIKDEKGNPINHDLVGAVNDAETYRDLLNSKFGVKAANIKVITDGQANEQGFVTAIKWLLATAKAGDQVFFQFSGHGTQFDSKDEADGKQEAIVLQDYTLVPGDIFNTVAKSLSAAGVNSTFLFDSCFSGGMSRDPMTYDGKAIKTNTKRALSFTKKEKGAIKIANSATMSSITKAAVRPKQTTTGQYLFLFAGQEGQPTSDLSFKDPTMKAHGLFTLVFGSLMENMPEAPMSEAIAAVAQFMKDKGFAQEPMMESSSADRAALPMLLK
ncbi:MAG: caspase family protein [Chthonomonas sp.]|nr:caspase family protein [Chthonomonas sp.]